MRSLSINRQNPFAGKIKEIFQGPFVSEVDVETPYGLVTSVISTRALQALGLKSGVAVQALVKATDVSLARL